MAINKPETLQQEETQDFLSNVDVTIDGVAQLKPFNNDYARVRTDLVIQPKGMPPSSWGLL